jgi:hypothetical protein
MRGFYAIDPRGAVLREKRMEENRRADAAQGLKITGRAAARRRCDQDVGHAGNGSRSIR